MALISAREFRQQVAAWAIKGQRKFEVTCRQRCGHDLVVRLRVNGGLSELEQAESQRCAQCSEPDPLGREVVYGRAYEEANARAAEAGFPALTGTRKQVGWANVLRLRAVRLHGLDAIKDSVMDRKEATWWIAHRDRLRDLVPPAWATESAGQR